MYTLSKIKEMISKDNVYPFYNDRYWRYLSADVIRENNGECYLCRQKKKVVPAVLTHHVKPLKKFPQFAYSKFVENEIQLMPLCHDCHEMLHDRGIYQKRRFNNEELW